MDESFFGEAPMRTELDSVSETKKAANLCGSRLYEYTRRDSNPQPSVPKAWCLVLNAIRLE